MLITIYRLVFPHAFAEETILWPAIRRVLDDGEAVTLGHGLRPAGVSRPPAAAIRGRIGAAD